MRAYHIAILGASGVVGSEIRKILEKSKLEIASLKLLVSKRSAGKKVLFRDEVLVMEETTIHSFKGIDLVFGAVDNQYAKKFLPYAVREGSLVIDNSSAYRLDPNVPLIIPEINGEDIKNHQGIIANPNCATIIALMAVYSLHQIATIKSMIVSTYQAVSGAGYMGMRELQEQVKQLFYHEPVSPVVFPYQIAYNLIPQIGSFDEYGYSSEEMKLQNEGRKILHAPDLEATCTCVRLPVLRSHSESITLFFENEISVEEAKKAIQKAKGVVLLDDVQHQVYPMPLDTSEQDYVSVGRIRRSMSDSKHSLTLWCCGDQIRKGAALNAVEIAYCAIEKGLLS